ncbi:MAG: PaaI family thioesterase [Elusimicrobia bacterium]|nr:PaaI family thioesterase [Elusimicrobiota bacterium]
MKPPTFKPKPGWTSVDPFWQMKTSGCYLSRDGSDRKLKIRYYAEEGKDCFHALVWFGPDSEGPPGHAHGGAVAAVLDEALGAAAWARGLIVMTAKLTVKFRRAVPLGLLAVVDAHVRRAGGSRVLVSGSLTDGRGRTFAEAEGIFLKVPRSSWKLFQLDDATP